jgi:hypothetical protein
MEKFMEHKTETVWDKFAMICEDILLFFQKLKASDSNGAFLTDVFLTIFV